jgi:hypothetical protein
MREALTDADNLERQFPMQRPPSRFAMPVLRRHWTLHRTWALAAFRPEPKFGTSPLATGAIC